MKAGLCSPGGTRASPRKHPNKLVCIGTSCKCSIFGLTSELRTRADFPEPRRTPLSGSPTSENAQKAKFAEIQKGEVRRILIPRTSVNRGKKVEGPSTTGSSKRPTMLVSDRALSHARALRGSLASVYASCYQGGRVEAKNPAPRWVPKGRAEPAAQPATAKIAGGGAWE